MGFSGDVNECHFCIFLCKESATAISYQNGFFVVFDSHSRNAEGLTSPDGTSVVIQKKTLQELCLHLRHVVNGNGIGKEEQFDLHVIKICTVSEFKLRYEHKVADVNICSIPNDISVKSKKAIVNDRTDFPSCEDPIAVKLIDLPFVQSSIGNDVNMNKKKRKKRTGLFSPHKKQRCHDPEKLVSDFHLLISRGPEYVCVSCSQLFFKRSVEEFKYSQKLPENLLHICVKSIKTVNNKEWICKQCKISLMESKVPSCSIGNGFCFPVVPNELQGLTKLEERLISPRIPFMQIKELPRGGQLSVHGNIVNVPADVNKTVKLLPRNMDASETIPIKLKRGLNFKSHIAYEQVRPEKILIAAKWLIRNSRLFQNEGIELNENWNEINNESLLKEKEIQDRSCNSDCEQGEQELEDEWSEDDGSVLKSSGNLDTVMHPADFREFNRILSVAPAEGNTPLGMFQDRDSEFLSFPAIYCGETRKNNNSRSTPVHFSTICKWELRNSDRRVAQNVTNIFFKLKKIADKANI